ncbi:MAG: sulfatase [Bacteroidota bacterium]
MNKLHCLNIFLVTLAVCFFKEGKSEERPNILFILTDDQSQIDVGAYGHPVLKTPNIDQLGKEGMRFNNAFTSTAMCVPSRSSLFTGLHPMRHGAHPNHSNIKEGVVGIGKYLDSLGYQVGIIGKIHVKPISAFGFDLHKELLDYAWDSKLTKEEIQIAMDSLAASGNPFVLFVCIANPHTPWPGDWKGDINQISLPPYLLDIPITRETVSNYYAHVEFADRKVGEVISVAKDLGLYEDLMVFFSSDHGAVFPHGKYNLYDAGIKVPFIVRWPGKITAGSKNEALIQFVDVLPTLIDIAGDEPNGYLDGKSILPLLFNEKQAIHKYIYATSSKDRTKTDYPIKAVRSKRYKYIINTEHQEVYTSWITDTDSTMRKKNPAKYHRQFGYWPVWKERSETDRTANFLVDAYLNRPKAEFYDLQNDPYELENLIHSAELNEVKEEMKKKLEEWMIDQKDIHYSKGLFARD